MQRRILLNIFLVFLAFVSLPRTASADLMNPDFYSKACSPSETLVKCSYKSTKPFGPKTYNDCARYENNPNYKFLVAEGHSFGGSVKYCFKAISTTNSVVHHVKVLLPLLLVTLLLELPTFIFLSFRGRRALLTVLSANLISVPLLYLATVFMHFSGFILLLAMELAVIVFEALFLKLIVRETRLRKILIYSFVANTVSAILGGVLLNTLRGFLMF